jgi:hypothetical protein
MGRLHAPNEFLRIRRLRERMRAWEELWRLLADGPAPAREPGGRRWLRRFVKYQLIGNERHATVGKLDSAILGLLPSPMAPLPGPIVTPGPQWDGPTTIQFGL